MKAKLGIGLTLLVSVGWAVLCGWLKMPADVSAPFGMLLGAGAMLTGLAVENR
jgi:hypothetical protein